MLLLAAALAALQGCASLRGDAGNAAPASDSGEGGPPVSFELDVVSDNRRIASHLETHLDIQRYAGFPDLQPAELRRLLGAAETNARDLLAALGYFNPQLTLQMADPADGGSGRRRVVIEVDPGEVTRVSDVDIRFAEPMAADPAGERQRESIRDDWTLKSGNAFSQEAWDAAKAGGLRVLQRRRYPTARIADSRATVDAEANRARLDITYDAGPLFRFGELELQGVERYDAQGIRHIARIPVGDEYTEEALLDAQQRLVSSGYFDSAFLMLDTEDSDPGASTVIAQLREAKYQKVVFGLGYSTDAGPRFSVDHTHNEIWPLGWRALNQVAVGTNTQSLATRWSAMPQASGWAWYTGATLERTGYGDYTANSVSLLGGRARSTDRTERRYYLQYDASKAEGSGAPGGSSSLLANYAWTGRYFNNRTNPTRGFGVGAEAGVGYTVTPQRDPFLRVMTRALQLIPFGSANAAGRRNRFALRAEAGAIVADDDVNIPVTLLFLSGGDTTVRGYGYQSIGNRLDDGTIYGGRYMMMGSVEWQRPIRLFGDAGSWEHAVFVDAGSASDNLRDSVVYTGVGTGLRWSSPVGPLQIDVARGMKTGQWRLHLRMGFQF